MLVILNKGIVLCNSNNGNVMVNHSVSCYHAHFRIQDREGGNETVGFLLRVLVVAFGNFFSVLGIKGG